ncbi:hypothetical protein E3G67_003663 [Mycobacteroides abscessus]|nr:hypothetical protein [Mycobacteroides abscessus]MDM2082808.1 hypothetical protein [Mycobacteroides abscessus]MDM2085982.1 hypothetical protein [Mycobacteroides abscessus]
MAVPLNFLDAPLDQAGVASGLFPERAQVLNEFFVDGGDRLGLPRGMLGIPDQGDGLFNSRDSEVWCIAAGLLALPSGARVVLVQATVAAAIDGVDQSGAAPSAVQNARKVLQVFAFPVAAASIGGETVLYLPEGALIDERLVVAGVFDAAECRVAQIEASGEHFVHLAALQWALSLICSGANGESTVVQQSGQAAQRHVGVGGVGVEGPADMIGAVGIDGDLPGFAAVDGGANVEVADGGSSNGASAADFLFHAFENFLGEVGAVEVGDRGEDAVDKLALWRFVDVLGDGDKLGAGLADRKIDGDVISAIAGEAIDLVNDDEVDVVVP